MKKTIGIRLIILLVAITFANSTVLLAQNSIADKVHKLKEITVRVKPVEQHGDTLNYNMAAYISASDRKLTDLLAKLPGITVTDNGRILYNDKPINRFNIEGQDLLGHRYNLATNSLPAEAIAQIQVVENDQPIQAMRSTHPTDRATLNVKLKQSYRMRIFGQVAASAGYGDDFLGDLDALLATIGKNNQLMAIAKANNTGNSLEDLTAEHLDVNTLRTYTPI